MKKNNSKKAVIIHSGGMDSSICLALAILEFGSDQVLSMSFRYNQRHHLELAQAAKICLDWKVDHTELDLRCLSAITDNALVNPQLELIDNTLVTGRNGLMAHIGGIHANYLGARCIYLGVIEADGANNGYRDCNRNYINLAEQKLRLDLNDPNFAIRTPLISMSKKETLTVAYQLGILEYLLQETITCYQGIAHAGCRQCPSCQLRNQGLSEFIADNPSFLLPY